MNRPSLRLLPLGLALGALAMSAATWAAAPLAGQFGGGFGKNKVQYREFDWQIYHSPHFNVYYYSEEEPLLQKVVSFAESAYDQLSREFNHQIQEPVPLIYYATHSAFEQNNIILNFIPEGVGAFATPARFRMVLPVDLPDPELLALILHELTHVFQYHILFQGSLAKAVTTPPPGWFMEGMASYMAKDESARDKMFLRDAVVNDQIPSITRGGNDFFVYRFGHAVFDFIEERWGKEGFLDFLYEMRNTIGSRVDRAVERTFRLDAEEFDAEFRRWLRKKYLPELVRTGEPADFGKLFRVKDRPTTYETSPAASPSGDLVAAFSSYRGDVDVVLFDAEKRQFLRNLTRGFSNDYQYLVAQELRLGRKTGRDLSFSPDGNWIAVFGKRERGRSLLILDVLNGGVERIVEMNDLEQQLSPAWSTDGKKVAFSAFKDGKFDIFVVDLESLQVENLTNDEVFDGAPVYSPDGNSLVFASVVGTTSYSKLFRIDLAQPGQRFQLTTGESNENDPAFSPDGKRIYFASDRDGGIENIYSLDLASGETHQHTNVVTGAFMPTVLREPDGEERLVYTGFWKGVFDLYVSDLEEPVAPPKQAEIPSEPTLAQDLPAFEPDIQVTVDEGNKEKYGGFKFFLEDAESFVGVDDDQTFLGRVLLTFSDYLGDKRILASFASIESFSNFDIIYADLSSRLQWQVHLFDNRDFFIGQDQRGFVERGRAALTQTGAIASIIYPFSFYRRAELGAGYILRKIDFQSFVFDDDGNLIPIVLPREDDFPIVTASLTGDSSIFASWGAVSGRRWTLSASYAPDLEDSGTLTSNVSLDFRQYFPLTQRSNFAFRTFVGVAEGNFANPFFFGGLDTVRGFRFRELVGDRAFFTNLELRFPLIDFLATPILGFQGIRGIFFLDVGGAYFSDFQEFDFYDSDESQLEDGVASYGWGVTANLLGLSVNWDFAKRIDPPVGVDEGFRTSFWVGTRF